MIECYPEDLEQARPDNRWPRVGFEQLTGQRLARQFLQLSVFYNSTLQHGYPNKTQITANRTALVQLYPAVSVRLLPLSVLKR
jgi:hypothetical protein